MRGNKIEARYIVDKEKRKVVCILTNTKNALQNFITNRSDDIIYAIPVHLWEKNISLPRTFSGVASCAEGDEWDEEIGKKLAYSRARYKFDKSFFKHANWFIRYCDKTIDGLYTSINKYGEKISNNYDKRMKELEDKFGEEFELFGKE